MISVFMSCLINNSHYEDQEDILFSKGLNNLPFIFKFIN